jgi:hypothetical protein
VNRREPAFSPVPPFQIRDAPPFFCFLKIEYLSFVAILVDKFYPHFYFAVRNLLGLVHRDSLDWLICFPQVLPGDRLAQSSAKPPV